MRMLTDRYGVEERELFDGIKVHRSDGWVLVLPDSFEQVFHVISEGPTKPDSERILSEMTNELGELIST